MATVTRRRTLINPARRTRRRGARRHMTPAQIKYFGTKRQKAGLRAARKNRAHGVKLHRRRSRPRALPRRAKRSNPGEILTLGLAAVNPHRKRKNRKRRTNQMAAHRKRSTRRRARSSYKPRRRRRSNPVVHRRRRRRSAAVRSHRRRSRRNPSAVARGLGVGSVTGYVTQGLWAIGGMLGTRMGTEAVLGAKNAGIFGYIGNIVAAVLLGQVVGRGMKNQAAGRAVTFGGILGTVARAVTEFTPFGSYVTQAFQVQGVGDWQVRGLGEYIQNPSFQPMQQQNTNWPTQVIPAVIARTAAAAGPRAMAGMGSRYNESRYR